MAQPSSQKYRPISFVRISGSGWSGARHDLIIRPEELTRQEPFRATVHNTLGGAYVDAFGRGIGTILLSGTTGWRGGPDEDGAAKFDGLRDFFFSWEQERKRKVSAGMSPDSIEIGLIDTLNGFELSVVPMEFTLLRHKQRPLLRQFNIRLAVVRDLSDPPSADFDSIIDAITSVAGRVGSALAGLGSAASGQAQSASTLAGMGRYLGPLAGAGAEYLGKSKSLIDTVRGSVQSVTGTIDDTLRPVFELTRDIQQAGRNIFHAADVIAGVPNHVINEINAIAGNLQGAYCNMVNGFDRIESIFDLDPLFGASNCSSTGGGRPISPWENANPFESLSPSVPPAPQTTASRDAMRWAQSLDPVASPLTAAQAADRLNRINEGLLV